MDYFVTRRVLSRQAVGIGIVGFVSWTLSSLPSNTEFLSVAFVSNVHLNYRFFYSFNW